MDLIAPFCGSARTSLHNQVFLEGVKSALLSARGISSAGSGEGGRPAQDDKVRTWSASEKEVGLKAFGRVYAGWGFSQAFYREKLYESVLGFKDLEHFMIDFWEKWATSKGDPEDSEYEVANMKPGRGRIEAFPSIWGHWAGGPGDSKEDVQWLDEKLKTFLKDIASCREDFARGILESMRSSKID
ncbi:MAG: hypothetical protein M1837_005332 [Sclerophora amabilis]|nr:MAG: hypothetical protein M1837_005332 [Sclerophora amabilis]